MSLIGIANKERPILITGKSGTGKSTMAKTLVGENPLVYYADEMVDIDWRSITNDVIIEEVHYKAKKDVIMDVIRHCKTNIVLTSNNEKDVPKDIKNSCKIRRAGTNPHLRNSLRVLAPRSLEPDNPEKSIIDIVGDFMRNTDRESVIKSLKHNKPADVQILTWLGMNIHPNKLVFVDGNVKRRWSSDYFYEMLAYSHNGRMFSKLNFPKKGAYSQVPKILRKLNLKLGDAHLLPQLLQDSNFEQWVKKRLLSSEARIIGIQDVKKRNSVIIPDRTLKLERWL